MKKENREIKTTLPLNENRVVVKMESRKKIMLCCKLDAKQRSACCTDGSKMRSGKGRGQTFNLSVAGILIAVAILLIQNIHYNQLGNLGRH